MKIIVAKCQMTKCVFAHGVPQKGLDPKLYAVERLKRDVLWLGHNRVILKSDNEHAIRSLLRNILKVLRIERVWKTHKKRIQLHTTHRLTPLLKLHAGLWQE